MSKRPNALVAHPGTQYAPQLARELFTRRVLSRFVTGFVLADSPLLCAVERALPARLKQRYASRRVAVSACKIHNFAGLEAHALMQLRLGAAAERVLHARNEAFQNRIPDAWIRAATHVVGYDTSSWILAERSTALSRPFLLDRTIGHPRAKERIYHELRTRFPEWSESIPAKDEVQLQREDLEHRLATHIVVPSAFVRDTLVEQSVAANRISVIPFGTNLDLFRPADVMPPIPPVVFLFAGTLGVRKGLPVLLEAWKQATLGSRAQLWVVGPGKVPESARRIERVRYFGRVDQVQLAALMRRAHVFVFPSFFEGLAQVQVEALATGLPIIGTYESGVTEVVIEGETGFTVPVGSVAHFADCMSKLSEDLAQLARLRARCIQTRDSRGWHIYGDKWFSLLERVGIS